MKFSCTGVILAGGRNTRLSGRNKAFIRVGGKRIINRLYHIFKDLFEETILVTNDPIQYLEWDYHIVTDLFPIRCSLTGIHAGLFYTATSHAFFAACDSPFLKKDVVETIINGIEPGIDVLIPETSEGLEPLCAVYSKQCLKVIEQQIVQQKLKINRFFSKVHVKKIPEDILLEKDPNLISFFNINTPEDMERAEKMERGTLGRHKHDEYN